MPSLPHIKCTKLLIFENFFFFFVFFFLGWGGGGGGGGGGWFGDPNFFLHISFSWVEISFNVEFHPPGLPRT